MTQEVSNSGKSHLVDGGNDLGIRQDLLLEKFLRAVRDAYRADLALLQDGLHLLPRVAELPVTDDITVPIRERRETGVVAVRVQVDGPVDEEH